MTPNLPIGNGGNLGFGGNDVSTSWRLPNLLGRRNQGVQDEIFDDGFDFNAGVEGEDLLMHPGGHYSRSDEFVIARYTISESDILAGTRATIDGSFRNLVAPGGNRVTGSVYHNAALLFEVNGNNVGAADSLTQEQGTFNVVTTVAAGDTISFVVGSNADINADETALRATIDLVVAEPAIPLVITGVHYDPGAHAVTLTWRNSGASSYAARYSLNMTNWEGILAAGLNDALDEVLEDGEQITVTLPLTGVVSRDEAAAFFRIEEE